MEVEKNKVVTIHYTLTNDEGAVLDSSEGKTPLKYLHGNKNLIEGLENALLGKKVGDKLHVVIEPADAYGEKRADLIQEVPKEAFQGVEDIQVGMQFNAQAPDGSAYVVTVTNVAEDKVTIDANHDLAGVRLTFDVEVIDVRNATDEEIEHGHVH
jgi:FKBP-type peptidyl-prolyl cis-trans isomerase SlyD